MADLDFGEISGYVPEECCDLDFGDITGSDNIVEISPVRTNQVLLAHKEVRDGCCHDRKYTVNLHMNDSWSFTFTNGDFLTKEQIDTYCNEISAAQSMLETQEKWRQQGRGLGKWDIHGPVKTESDGTVYFPAGRDGNSFGYNDSCAVQGPSIL